MNLRDPQSQKTILGVVLIAGLGYAFHQYLYKPKKTELAEKEAQAARLESYNQTAKAAAQTNRIAALEQESVSFERRLDAFEELIPTNEQVPELLERVATAALEADVDLLSFTPLPAEPGTFYTEQFYEVEVRAPYHNIGNFLARIANLPRIIRPTVTELVGERIESPLRRVANDANAPAPPPVTLVRAKLQLSTYVLPGGEATVVTGGAAIPTAGAPAAGAPQAPTVGALGEVPGGVPAVGASGGAGEPGLDARISPGVAPALEARQRASEAAEKASARAAAAGAGPTSAAPGDTLARVLGNAPAAQDPPLTQPGPTPTTAADLTSPGARATDTRDPARPGALPPLGGGN